MAACNKIVADLKAMDASSQKLEHEVNFVVQSTKDLKEELEELHTRQATIQNNFDRVRSAFDAQKVQLEALPTLQAQVEENQKQLNSLSSLMQTSLNPDKVILLRNKMTPEVAAQLLAYTQAIANFQ